MNKELIKNFDENNIPLYDEYTSSFHMEGTVNIGKFSFTEDDFYDLCNESDYSYEDVSSDFSSGELPAKYLNDNLKRQIKDALINGNFDVTNVDGTEYAMNTSISSYGKNLNVQFWCAGDGDILNPFVGHVDDLPFETSDTYALRYYHPTVVEDYEKLRILNDVLYGDYNTTFKFRDYLLSLSAQERTKEILEEWYPEAEADSLSNAIENVDDMYRTIDLYRKDFDRDVNISFEISDIDDDCVYGKLIIDDAEPIKVSYSPEIKEITLQEESYVLRDKIPTGFNSPEYQDMITNVMDETVKEVAPELVSNIDAVEL